MLRQNRTRPVTPSRHSDSEDRRSSRSSLVRKQSHWSLELKEVTLVARKDGVFNFRIVGGSDHGDFPVITEVMPPDTRGVEYRGQAELTTQVSTDNQSGPEIINFPTKIINSPGHEKINSPEKSTLQDLR